MITLRKIDHVCLRVADVADAARRYGLQFGLTVREQDARARATLACDYEPYSLELVAATGEPGARLRPLRLAAAPLGLARRRRAAPARHRDAPSRTTASHLVLRDDEDFEHHLLAVPAGGRSPARDRARDERSCPALRPRKLGHINRLTADLAGEHALLHRGAGHGGRRLPGRRGNLAARQQRAPPAGAGRRRRRPDFHHLAFDYYDFGTLRALFDNLAQHGRWLAWGPVRHGIAQNICGYVRITEEPLLVECYVDMELLEPDHEPRHWPDDRFSSNTWGPLPPRSYFRFDAPAIESERESLETRGIPLAPLAE